jgi:hypothetical protein
MKGTMKGLIHAQRKQKRRYSPRWPIGNTQTATTVAKLTLLSVRKWKLAIKERTLGVNSIKRRYVYLVVCFFLICSADAATPNPLSYLCIGEQATGFGMNAKTHSWAVREFRPRRYVIRAPLKGPNAPSGASSSVMAVYEFGKVDQASATAFCDKDFNEKGFLFCQGLGEEFNFNRQTLRFVHWFPHGFIEPPDFTIWGKEGEATPFMEIGTCSAI